MGQTSSDTSCSGNWGKGGMPGTGRFPAERISSFEILCVLVVSYVLVKHKGSKLRREGSG